MCGIFGIFSRYRDVESDALNRMGEALRHRGPDDHGVFSSPRAGIGNRRLSIIDVAGGHQPFVSDDGKIAVVQNGEIFNYVELAAALEGTRFACSSRSDTEVLLRLYERDGIDFLHLLNGMFAIAILDQRGETPNLYLARDRMGVKPLYYSEHDGQLLFASEIKALLAAGLSPVLDPRALDQYLAFNYVPPPRTMFSGVSHVNPGTYLTVTPSSVAQCVWWRLSDLEQVHGRSEQHWTEELLGLLDDAVRIRMRADVPFGAFLSGGVDSSTVVALMSRNASQPVRTFSIGFQEPEYDESRFALEAAKRFSTMHTMERVDANLFDLWPRVTWFCDQPHGDASFLPTYRLAELAAKHVKMVLTGDGGDELFAGYLKYQEFFARPGTSALDAVQFRRSYLGSLRLLGPDARSDLYSEHLAACIGSEPAEESIGHLFDESAHWDHISQALYVDTCWLLPGNNLVKPDRMGMAVSLEARTPFLDYRVVELAFQMPGDLKLRDGETKYLLKKAVSRLIGDNLAYRRKQMFTVPVGDWFRGALNDELREILLADSAVTRRLLNTDVIKRLLAEHISHGHNHTRALRALLALELWLRRFAPSLPGH